MDEALCVNNGRDIGLLGLNYHEPHTPGGVENLYVVTRTLTTGASVVLVCQSLQTVHASHLLSVG